MSKSRDKFKLFLNKMMKRQRSRREYKVPTDYIMAVADNLHRVNPTREIVYNTLVEFYQVAFERGYTRKGEDSAWFKAKKDKHRNDDFKLWLTYLDDLIHDKSGEKLSFTEWQNRQNQNKKK